jgi:hypothetical protein
MIDPRDGVTLSTREARKNRHVEGRQSSALPSFACTWGHVMPSKRCPHCRGEKLVVGQCKHCGWHENASARPEDAGLAPPLESVQEEIPVKVEEGEQPPASDGPTGVKPPASRRILYERLDRRTGWFETEAAIYHGGGLNHSRDRSHPFGNGLIRAIDGETGEPVWIKYAWNLLGIARRPDGGLDHWQVTLDEAGKWFPDNREEPHEFWFEDRKRENLSRPPGAAELPSSKPRPTIPTVTPLRDRGGEASHRVPSVDQLVEVDRALWWFSDLANSSITPTFAHEREVLPRFLRLADALRPIRPVIDKIDGWPTKIERALRSILKAFDGTASQWGWERLVELDPDRSKFLEERCAWVRENLERPLYEAALSWQAGYGDAEHCPVDDMADEGRRRDLVPTMTPAEGRARFEPAWSRLNREPHIGKCDPKIGERESAEFVRAFNVFHDYMLTIAYDRCSRPPWQEQNTVRQTAAASLASRPVPEDPHTSAPPSHSTKGTVLRAQNNEIDKLVRGQVFISYSHQDNRFLDDLLTQLKPYLRRGTVTAWSDKQIEPGSAWFDKIKAALAKTSVAVMLVSPDFLASDFIEEHELGPLLKEAAAGGVKILWVLIRDCSWRETPLKAYQSVLPPEKPLAGMSKAKRDTAWRRICETIKDSYKSTGSADTAPASHRQTAPSVRNPRDLSAPTATDGSAVARTTNSTAILQPSRVICPLHGIRTLGIWQKGLSDLSSSRGWVCRLDRWSFGRFSLLAFFTPWSREAKLRWLRRQYDAEINDRRLLIDKCQSPSVVAHSFGSYILGYTLLRFDFIRFNKVILCGSILPKDFPWDKLIDRGQVQAVRNEYGVRDPWVKRVCCFVRGTGPSGASGFTCKHDRFEQEAFEYDHGDYFGIDHMEDRWMPFLDKPLAEIPRAKDSPRIPRPNTAPPWGLYAVVLALALFAGALAAYGASRRGRGEMADGPASAPTSSAQPAPVPIAVLGGYVTDAETRMPLAGATLTIQDWDTRDGGWAEWTGRMDMHRNASRLPGWVSGTGP